MLTISSPAMTKPLHQSSDLHEIVDQLVASVSVDTSDSRNCFVNEIPVHMQLTADSQKFATVLGGVLAAVVSCTKDSSIRLSAKKYGNMLLVQVKESTSLNTNEFEREVSKLQPLAEKMRGSVCVTSQRKQLTTITFGFPNLP